MSINNVRHQEIPGREGASEDETSTQGSDDSLFDYRRDLCGSDVSTRLGDAVPLNIGESL